MTKGGAFCCALVFALWMAMAPIARADLAAIVDVAVAEPLWSYTILNNEPIGSPNYVYSFNLAVNAPIAVTGTPDGWGFQTDDLTYVLWFNTDTALPYPHDIGPGTTLGGFQISSAAQDSQSLGFTLSGWDHSLDQPGPTTSDFVLAPSTTSPVPEPASGGLVVMVLLLIVYLGQRVCRN